MRICFSVLGRIRVEELPIGLGELHGHLTVRVEGVIDGNVLVEPRPLQAFEAAAQPKDLNPFGQLFHFRRIGGVAREDLPGGADLDSRPFPADEQERGGGD